MVNRQEVAQILVHIEDHLHLVTIEVIHQDLVLLVLGQVLLLDHHQVVEVLEVARDHQVVVEDVNPNLLKRKFKI